MFQLQVLLTKELAKHLPLTRPPEPTTAEFKTFAKHGVYIGRSRWLHKPFFYDPSSLINPHIAVLGITGSGKSFFVKTFLSRASYIWNTKTIILDWTGEYREWVERLNGTVIDVSHTTIDPFAIEGNVEQQVMQTFDSVFNLKKNMPVRVVVHEVVREVVKERGNINTFIKKLSHRKDKEGKVAYSLFKDVYAQQHSPVFELKQVFSGLVCIDLHTLPTDTARALVATTVLQYLKEKMRGKITTNNVPEVLVVLDEAWKLSKDDDSEIVTIIREGRKYNFAVIVATQNPTDLSKVILSNVGSLFIFKTHLKEYRQFFKETLNLSEWLEKEIENFGVGTCLVKLAPKQQLSHTAFIIKRVDGEPSFYKYFVQSLHMFEMDQHTFVKKMKAALFKDEDINECKRLFEQHEGVVNAEDLITFFKHRGYSTPFILSFLRELGMSEEDVIYAFKAYSKKRAQRQGKRFVSLGD